MDLRGDGIDDPIFRSAAWPKAIQLAEIGVGATGEERVRSDIVETLASQLDPARVGDQLRDVKDQDAHNPGLVMEPLRQIGKLLLGIVRHVQRQLQPARQCRCVSDGSRQLCRMAWIDKAQVGAQMIQAK
jgi:hypothetical protein